MRVVRQAVRHTVGSWPAQSEHWSRDQMPSLQRELHEREIAKEAFVAGTTFQVGLLHEFCWSWSLKSFVNVKLDMGCKNLERSNLKKMSFEQISIKNMKL